MQVCTLDELREIMRQAAGEVDAGAAAGDLCYAELGYDSLALLEIAARIKQIWGVELPEEAVATTATPAATLAAVNLLLPPQARVSGHTDNRVRIEAPMEQVWAVTNDVASWPWLFSEYAAAEILEAADDYVRFRLTMRPENNQTWSWVSERRLDPANHVVHAHRVETGPFVYMNIRWEYRVVGDAVEMRWLQDFQMKATAPLDNAAMTERINRNTAAQLARIKQLIESGEAARRVGAA